MSELLIDVGSTYFKVSENGKIDHFFRNFNKNIYDDLTSNIEEILQKYKKEDIYICSSANGGLSTLIVGVTESFSIKYAKNIAFNSGIDIIDTVLYKDIQKQKVPNELIDVVIVVGGIDCEFSLFDDRLIDYLKALNYQHIVYIGNINDQTLMRDKIDNVVILKNIINKKLQVNEDELKNYLTNLYQQNIIAKEEIKHLYDLTTNQIYSTPYIVNRSLSKACEILPIVDPYILIDIGGATTDIHYSRDLVMDNMLTKSKYDRLVFKKLGVYKSRDSLVFAAKNNEFVYELLAYLNVTENILEEQSKQADKVLMQLAIFLVLYKTSLNHKSYINLHLEKLNSIVLTGGVTKVLEYKECENIIGFFYKKILHFHEIPDIVIDNRYQIWTMGIKE